MNESLFPCDLSKDTLLIAEDAVEKAVKSWGKASLTELEAEDRLSYSCEKVYITLCYDHFSVPGYHKSKYAKQLYSPLQNTGLVTHTLQSTEILRRDIGSKRSRFDESISYVRGPHEMR